jgi:CubicO group peptidase (beta-lactamase class C family)
MRAPAPLDSWQLGPWNRWAYQHVDEMVPTVVVARGDGPVMELPEQPLQIDVEDPPYADGVAVVRGGALVLERYRNGMEETTLHLSQSVGKSVLGLLAGVLELDPAAAVVDYVPEVAGSGYDGARVQHLLDMTAAIDFVEDYEAGFWRYDVACAWHPPHPDAPAATILEFLPTIGAAEWEHGERLHYATPNTDLLGIVAERAGGAPLAELISRELWSPLGAEHDALLTVDHAGTAAIGGGFCATLRDYARIGELVRRGDLVPTHWLARLGVGDEAAFARRTWATNGATGYGRQWWRVDGRTTARGIHGQLIAVGRETVVAILSSWPEATGRDAAHRAFVDAVS